MSVLAGFLACVFWLWKSHTFFGGALVFGLMLITGEAVKSMMVFPFVGYFNCKWGFIDSLMVAMVFMSILVCLMALICSESELHSEFPFSGWMNSFELVIVLSILSCIITFWSANWFSFFVFYEFSLVPIIYMILKWGYQPERLKAAVAMGMYSVCGGLPLLVNLVVFKWLFDTSVFGVGGISGVFYEVMVSGIPSIVGFFLIVSFMVKFPIYGLHDWLPKAHVEAPLAGSMILAGVMLKLGGYGLMRVLWVFGSMPSPLKEILMAEAMVGGIIASVLCVAQSDLKVMVAYSSVAHMSLCFISILSVTGSGWYGAVCLMFAHGITSPMLFAIAAISYRMSGSRSVVLSKGLLMVWPLFTMFCCFVWFLNMGFPPSLNFFSEVVSISSVKVFSPMVAKCAGIVSFFTGIYCFLGFSLMSYGYPSRAISGSMILSERSFYALSVGIFLCSFFFLSLDFFGL